MGFFKRFFCKKKEVNSFSNRGVANNTPAVCESSEMQYFIYLDNEVYGPFSLQELKNDYPIMEDTLITVDTLNGEWYEAKCFECFDELFNRDQGFYINEFGEIVKTK